MIDSAIEHISGLLTTNPELSIETNILKRLIDLGDHMRKLVFLEFIHKMDMLYLLANRGWHLRAVLAMNQL